MTATYDKLGIKFLYPENWRLTDEIDQSEPHAITLETPDGVATWTTNIYSSGADTEAILKEAVASLMETYDDCEISPLESQIGSHTSTGVEAMFYCLDFLIRAQFQIIELNQHVLLFWFQAEDRVFDKQDLVFQAMAVSLIQSID